MTTEMLTKANDTANLLELTHVVFRYGLVEASFRPPEPVPRSQLPGRSAMIPPSA